MKILGIETSCDDTGVAVLEAKLPDKLEVISNVISFQVKIHEKYGGVFPTLAKREHQRNLVPVMIRALKEARLLNSKFKNQKSKLQFKIEDLNKYLSKKIDLIAVTVGPGLEPCLWVGVNFAKELAKKLKVPLLPVNHIEAHLIANFISFNQKLNNFKMAQKRNQNKIFGKFKNLFPAVGLVVSGGHTELVLIKDIGKYKILGQTRDDAAGECFDKTARILGLPYPGGPAIAAVADQKQNNNLKFKIDLPRPMINQKNYDFSFSGLKTAVLYKVKSEKQKAKSKSYVKAMASEIQQAIIDVLIHKTLKAAQENNAKAIILGGGVAANKELRKQLKEKAKKELPKVKCLMPDPVFCTDNGAMIAAAGYYQWLKNKKKSTKSIEANANLRLK
jgi:N6-L-threonylcarbamoyladenine synthase